MKKSFALSIMGIFLTCTLFLLYPLMTLAKEPSPAEETPSFVSSSPLSDSSSVQNDSLSPPAQTLPIIIGYTDLDRFQNLSAIEIKHNEYGDVEPLLMAIFNLRSINAVVQDPDGSTRELSLEVVWDYQQGRTSVDSSVPGSYTEKGEICLPDGYAWGENVVQSVSMPVEVIIPDQNAVIVRMASWNEPSYAIGTGTSLDKFLTDSVMHSQLTYDEAGTSYPAKITWDISGIDTSVSGLYTITGSLSPALYTEFASDFNPQLIIHLSVQTENQPELNCVQPNLDWSLIHFYWVAPDLDMDAAKVMLAAGDGPFTPLTQYDDYSLTADGMELYLFEFSGNATYRLQVLWENLSTGIFTFTYNADNAVYTFGKYDVSGDRDGGDSYVTSPDNGSSNTGTQPSDGTGSNTGTQPPDNTQTGSTPPAENHPGNSTPDSSSSNTAANTSVPAHTNTASHSGADINHSDIASAANTVTEPLQPEPSGETTVQSAKPLAQAESPKQDEAQNEEQGETREKNEEEEQASEELLTSADYIRQSNTASSSSPEGLTSISGAQLKLMTAGGTGARFSHKGLMLTLPFDGIEGLNIQDSDEVMITLEPAGDNGFSLEIMVNGNSIHDFSNMEIMIPYTASAPVSVLQLLNHLGEEVAAGTYDNGIVTFTINQTGQYTISDNAVSKKEPEGKENSFSLPFILIISAGCLCLIGGGIYLFYLNFKKKKKEVD